MQFSVSNDFEILERIGAREGQSSRVFRVRHLLLGYECVAKLVNLAIVTAEGGDPLQEARILQAISHANVCEILGAGTIQAPELHQEEAASRPDLQLQSSPLTHLAMLLPFYAGGSLTSRLREGPLSVLEAVTLLLQTLKALEVVHAQGVLHLDLKPSNLLFRADGRLVLSDFGQSVRCDERGMAGGPAYAYQMCMPPEFYSPDRKLTTASDVYFAGCLAYRLLNGENFWNEAVHRATLLKGLVRSIREGSFPDRTFYMPHVPPPPSGESGPQPGSSSTTRERGRVRPGALSNSRRPELGRAADRPGTLQNDQCYSRARGP
jgi:serine/threonine protein kinase